MKIGSPHRSLVALMLVGAIATAQGCGGNNGASDASRGEGSRANIRTVSEAEIERYGADTPQHVALEWWRAVQVNDPESARTLYAEPPTLANLAGQFNFAAGHLAGMVKIASVRTKKPNRAIVTISWDKPREPERRVTVAMERRLGKWRIASVGFLDLLVQQLQKVEASAGQG